jgi:sulfide dehydrogenase cytochrome subunit
VLDLQPRARCTGVSTGSSAPSPTILSTEKENTVTPLYGLAGGSALIALALVALPARTQTTPLSGRLLASNCFQCHATDGRGGFERLTGESAAELFQELKELQSKSISSEDGIMVPHAQGYTDAQLRKIADYFASVR